jgi:hypothetical protein
VLPNCPKVVLPEAAGRAIGLAYEKTSWTHLSGLAASVITTMLLVAGALALTASSIDPAQLVKAAIADIVRPAGGIELA